MLSIPRSWKDCNEFEQEISKIESFPEIISRIDEYVAQLKEEVAYLKIGIYSEYLFDHSFYFILLFYLYVFHIRVAKAIVEERARIRSIKRAEARKVLEK